MDGLSYITARAHIVSATAKGELLFLKRRHKQVPCSSVLNNMLYLTHLAFWTGAQPAVATTVQRRKVTTLMQADCESPKKTHKYNIYS